jgi:hypothetical protein
MTTEGQGKRPRLEARLLMKRPLQFGQDARDRVKRTARRLVVRDRPPGRAAGRYGAIQARGGVVEIGVVASGAHGSRNRADEPCFARGGSTSQTPSERLLG